jgi:hypothetical protein
MYVHNTITLVYTVPNSTSNLQRLDCSDRRYRRPSLLDRSQSPFHRAPVSLTPNTRHSPMKMQAADPLGPSPNTLSSRDCECARVCVCGGAQFSSCGDEG